jgi:outer membrane protein, heavy metal efflux system
MRASIRHAFATVLVCAGAAGCATYRPLALPDRSNLAPALADLDRDVPANARTGSARTLDISGPLDLDTIGLLAILNDPELKSERGELGVAQAALLQASVLPNPVATFAYGALLGGPGTAPSYAASLSQDIAAIVTYRARTAAARAHMAEVSANQLWQEWQVAQKARLVALDLYWGGQAIAFQRRELALVSNALAKVQAATASGNLDLSALSPLLAAKASAEQVLATLELEYLKNWQALDALLGLAPSARFDIGRPDSPPLPPDLEASIEQLSARRPDLVALRLGYQSANETLRAAILGQFPAFALGGSWNSDTTEVRSAGPTVTFDLPLFNRNQGPIASSRATRLLLHEQYQSRLNRAVGDVRGLAVQAQRLSDDLVLARQAADSADASAREAESAYAQGSLDQRTWTDYETTALQRHLEVGTLERSLGETRIAITIDLGLGLPSATIAPPDRTADQAVDR